MLSKNAQRKKQYTNRWNVCGTMFERGVQTRKFAAKETERASFSCNVYRYSVTSSNVRISVRRNLLHNSKSDSIIIKPSDSTRYPLTVRTRMLCIHFVFRFSAVFIHESNPTLGVTYKGHITQSVWNVIPEFSGHYVATVELACP